MSFTQSSLVAQSALGVAFLLSSLPAAADEAPFGLEKRIPWDPTHLAGSPEPPLPYTVEKTFTKLTWKLPIYVADEPGTDNLWVVETENQTGNGSRIVRIKDDPTASESEVLLDAPNRLIYSVCFHPDYAANGVVFVFSNIPKNKPDRKDRISRYTVGREAPRRLDPDAEEVVLEWKSAGHDGGDMTFGRDGMFYLTTGDGTSDSDGWDSGQSLDDLLGSVLRIDVNHRDGRKLYSVPPDNPFVNTPGACPEIWAYGLRNPWRMCSDPQTGNIWVGNNGQDLWETAHLVHRGENYGWSVFEGNHPFYLERKRGPTPHVPPTIEHSHAEFRSLTGGVVYHGNVFPELEGLYIYGDYSSGRIWGMKHDGKQVLWHRELADTALQITAFRVDQRGELLIVDGGSGLYRLVRTPEGPPTPPFPTLLSQTGLFASTKEHQVDPALIPYSPIAEGWADGAHTKRFMAVPGDAKVVFESGKSFGFPDNSALMQTLSLDTNRIETRVLLRHQGEWAGYSYRWNADQSDAVLVGKDGADASAPQKWRFPSRAECMACHSRAANFVLGVTGAQLNRDHDYGLVRDNQLRTLEHIGLFAKPLPKSPINLDRLTNPADTTKDLEVRARTYLQVNCSVCHVEAGGGNAQMLLALTTPRDKMNLLSARPQHDTFGINNAMLVAPGDPDRSVLLYRVSRRGRGQMPPLVSNRVDEGAVSLIREWIAQLKPDQTFVKAWQMDDLLPELDGLKTGRSLESGRKAFRDTGCVQCHRFEGAGGSVGPDLSGVTRRLKPHEIVESVLLPSKVIAEPYVTVQIETHDGRLVAGRVEREDDRVVVLRPASSGEVIAVSKADIAERRRSGESNMPVGIVNVLRKEQVLDLLAYLLSDPEPKKPGER